MPGTEPPWKWSYSKLLLGVEDLLTGQRDGTLASCVKKSTVQGSGGLVRMATIHYCGGGDLKVLNECLVIQRQALPAVHPLSPPLHVHKVTSQEENNWPAKSTGPSAQFLRSHTTCT